MRVLKTLFLSVVMVSILGAVAALFTREVLIRMGTARVRESISTMRQVATNSGTYVKECQKRGVNFDTEKIIETIQLVFTSDREFQVEVICSGFQLDPIVVTQKTLPWLVTKDPGQSGIIWGAARTGVALSLWGRTRTVIMENQQEVSGGSQELELGTGPVAACRSYGFSCCALDASVGQGEQLAGALDCPRSCHSTCASRPVILSFASQPFYEVSTRTVTVQSGEQVEFSYVAEAAQGLKTVLIEFGDGQSAESSAITDNKQHTYTCATARCTYQASIKAVASDDITSATTPAASMTVVVQN